MSYGSTGLTFLFGGTATLVAFFEANATGDIGPIATSGTWMAAITLTGYAVNFAIKNIWPQIRDARLEYLAKRDALLANSMGSQLAGLNAQISDLTAQLKSQVKLNEAKDTLINQLHESLVDLMKKANKIDATVGQINEGVVKARDGIHDLKGDKQAANTIDELARRNIHLDANGDPI